MKATIVKANTKDAERWKVQRLGKGVSQDYKDFIKILEGLGVDEVAILGDAKSAGQVRYFRAQAVKKDDIPEGTAFMVLERDDEIGVKRTK